MAGPRAGDAVGPGEWVSADRADLLDASMSKLVYVVDDEPLVLDTVVFVLSSLEPDWEVQGFRHPLEALTAVQKRPPHLVLTDQRMPEQQGNGKV